MCVRVCVCVCVCVCVWLKERKNETTSSHTPHLYNVLYSPDRLEERLQNEVKLAVVLTLEVLEGVTDGYEVKDAVEVTDLVVLAEEPSDLEGVTLTLAVLDCDGEMLHGVLVGSAISSRRGVMRRSCG
jgi:hypothetical protein